MRRTGSWWIAAVLACACVDDVEKPDEPRVIAAPKVSGPILRVGDHTVSAEQFARLLGPAPLQRGREPEPQRRRTFLTALERTELLAIEARRRGVFDRPDMQRAATARAVAQLVDDLFGEQGSMVAPVTDDDVRDYYDENIELFSAKERVRARHILVKTSAHAKTLLARLRKDPLDLRMFALLATEHSLDESTKSRGGDLGSFSREPPPAMLADAITSASMQPRRIPVALREAAFGLEQAGDVSEPVKSEDGYHLVQLGARLPATRYDIEQVRQIIQRTLREQRQKDGLEAFTQQLLKDAKVTIHQDKLKLVRY